MESRLFFSAELVNAAVNKLSDEPVDISFEKNSVYVKTKKKLVNITAEFILKNIKDNTVKLECVKVSSFMPDVVTSAAASLFRGMINGIAKAKLPPFIEVKYPYIIADLNKVAINDKVYLTDIGGVQDVKLEDGIIVELDI